MYASWSTDLHEYHAHQRKIVRHFAPHLSNDALSRQERVYFVIGVTRLVVVFALPSIVAIVVHTWFLKTPVFVLVALVTVFELAMAIYRYLVLWPEGHKNRWSYWREIEASEDCYRLKIMGYYHRKIAKFTGRFPSTMASSEIRQHYRKRGITMVALFGIAYIASLVLLARTTDADAVWTWIWYLLATGCGLVIFRFIKMHYIELPQVLELRDHPEFSVVLVPPGESIPFARPVTTYDATEAAPPPRGVHTSISTEKATPSAASTSLLSVSVGARRPVDVPRACLRMNRPSRCLEYAGVDAAWEARELRAFSSSGAIRSAHAVSSYLLGRLLEEDLHVSCKPMLPASIQDMNGVMLQGALLLQVVDIVNIGANFEHRTEDSKGPTRTLKLCLTDGHQTVSGFEYKWMSALSVKTPRGAKVLVENVAVRHGVLMLTPETCQVLGASGNDALDVSKSLPSGSTATDTATPSGAYSAALVNAGVSLPPRQSNADDTTVTARASTPPVAAASSARQQPVNLPTPMPPRTTTLPRTAADLIGLRSNTPPSTTPTAVVHQPTNAPPNPSRAHQNVFSPPRAKAQVVNPAVFVDISSEDEDMASDATDPMVEHLFYSPNTPRMKGESRNQAMASRKRPHPESSRSRTPPPPAQEVVDITDSPPAPVKREKAEPPASALPVRPTAPRIQLDSPFVYFNTRTSALAEPQTPVGGVITVRAFMKSVTGFQFNTGIYNLRVLVEDGTATRDVQVDPALVEALMGVSCTEFATAMQSTPSVAHRLAAKMQVTLMTMQGLMRLRRDAIADKWTLLQCRGYAPSETQALLARVRHFATESKR